MVERGPEKAGVGGSIPSLGTFPSTTWQARIGMRKGYFFDFCAFLRHFAVNLYVHSSSMNSFIPPENINILRDCRQAVSISYRCLSFLTLAGAADPDERRSRPVHRGGPFSLRILLLVFWL